MHRTPSGVVALAISALLLAQLTLAQGPADPATFIAAQQRSMAVLSIMDGAWHEVGDRVVPGQPPVRIFEMNLKRVGNTDWPGAGAIPQR